MEFNKPDDIQDVTKILRYWYSNQLAQTWLSLMQYDVSRVKNIKISLTNKNSNEGCIELIAYDGALKKLKNIQNLQVKLISNKSDFNQIDKRSVDTYKSLWDMPNAISKTLKHFTGELSPYIDNSRDSRRMFIDELSNKDREALFTFLRDNHCLIINDILKGRGKFSAEWMLVIIKDQEPLRWALKPINIVLNYFGNGEIKISPKGSINIGRITMQRKGGDNGRPTANMLQFKIDPTKLLDV